MSRRVERQWVDTLIPLPAYKETYFVSYKETLTKTNSKTPTNLYYNN